MITNIQDTQTGWTIINGTLLLGYIHKLDTGKFEARIPHKGSHKGGLAISIGVFDSFEDAQTALAK